MAKQNLLLVDDDPKSRRVMEVSLRNAGFAVTTAADGVEGLSKAEALRPALILSDTGLPGMDGLALCERVKAHEKLKDTPFVFLTDDAAVRTKVRGLELGADDYLTRPIYIQEVITRVHMLLKRRDRARLTAGEARFYGQLADVSVVDVLQTLEAGGKSGTVTVRGAQTGRIFFVEGRVVDAQAGKRGGAEAVYRMLTWREGRFEVDFRKPERPHRIETSVQALLLEGMRRVDEWGRMQEQLPPLETVFEVDYGELAERLDELPDAINGLLRLFDGRRSALQVVDDGELPDLDALSAITRLYFEGILYPAATVEPEPPPPPTPAEPQPDLASWLQEARQTPAPSAPPLAGPPVETPPVAHAPVGAAPPVAASAAVAASAVAAPHFQGKTTQSLVDDLLASAAALPARSVQAAPAPAPQAPPAQAAPTPAPEAPPAQAAPTPEPQAPAPEADAGLADPPTTPLPRVQPGVDPTPAPPVRMATPAHGVLHHEAHFEEASMPVEPILEEEPSLTDHAHEQAFFDAEHDDHHDLFGDELVREPMPRAAWFAIGLIAVALVGGGAYFGLRDTIEPLPEAKDALDSRWHTKALDKRPKLAALAPLSASWRPPGAPKSAAAPATQAAPPSAPASAPESAAAPASDAGEAPKTAGAAPKPKAPKAEKKAPAVADGPNPTDALKQAPKPAGDFDKALAGGLGHFKAGRYRKAAKEFEAALAARPNNDSALVGAAKSYLETGEEDKALQAARRAVKANRNNADAHLIMGNILQDRGEKEAAIEAYNRYLKLAPTGKYAREIEAVLETLN